VPITTALDKVRLLIGDTDSTDPLLSDDEVNVQITNWPNNVEFAAANCAQQIAAKFARGFDFSSDGQTFNRSERVNHYTELARVLRRKSVYSIPLLDTAGTTVFNLGTAT
jgi:hypothetical protein